MIAAAILLGLAVPALDSGQSRSLVSLECAWGQDGGRFMVLILSDPDEIQFDRSLGAEQKPLLKIGAHRSHSEGSDLWRTEGSGEAGGHLYAVRLDYKDAEAGGAWTIAGTEDGKPFGGACERTMLSTVAS